VLSAINQPQNYRDLIKTELNERLARRVGYSLRAFARDLKISPGYLSQVIAERRGLSEAKAHTLAQHCKWSVAKKKYFLKLVRFERETAPDARKIIAKELSELCLDSDFYDIKLDVFQAISS
jgi:plasmid maintenance system antidote protein VapI